MTKTTLQVPNDAKGTRLDVFMAYTAELSRSRVQSLISDGHITVDSLILMPSYKLKGHETISWQIPPALPTVLVAENIALDILYADNDIIVLNKPAGLVVHPGAGNWTGTLVQALLHHFPDMQIGDSQRPGIVHRLDKDTSGVMVCARNDNALLGLTKEFKSRKVEKIYKAFCVGIFKEPQFELITGHSRHATDRKRFTTRLKPPAEMENGDFAGGHKVKLAHSRFTVVEQADGVSELSVTLLTGRTHQIRAHLADIHKPLVQDALYGGDKAVLRLKPGVVRDAALSLHRHALHAETLQFSHPRTGEGMIFTAPLPDDLQLLHNTLQQKV